MEVVRSGDVKTYRCGTLTYTKMSLAALFAWLLWGDFCFTLMETVVPGILPLKLKDLGCPNWLMGVMLTTIPGVMNVFLCPWVSFKSDRYRSRWGRRIPFILFTLPFLSGSVALLGCGDDICALLRQYSPAMREYAPATVTIVLIAVFIVIFRLFNVFVNSVFWYLFNDVVPSQFIARFLGLFRIVGTAAATLYNYFLFQYAGSHMREIFIGAAVLYFVGFGITCLMVKEGEYPPVEGETDRENKGWGGIRTFFRESFSHKIYWLLFAFAVSQSLTGAIYTFNVFFQQEMGLSLDQIGKMGAVGGVASLFAMYFTAIFIDRWHPLRVVAYLSVFAVIGALMNWVWVFVSMPADYFFWLSTGMILVSTFQTTLGGGCGLPLYMRLFPQSRFGQFCSAQAMLNWGCIIVAGVASGFFIDLISWFCGGTNFAYRFVFVWSTIGSVFSAAIILVAYRKWHALGGDKSYHPPAPWNERGIEEMPVVPIVGPQSKWLGVSLHLFHATMIFSVAGTLLLMWWMFHESAMTAFFWHACLLLPLSLLAWLYWLVIEKGIRRDMVRSAGGSPLRDGIPHHGVMFIVAIKFLLMLGLWVAQVVVVVNMKMDSGAIVFTSANIITNFMIAGGVQLLCKVERGFSTKVDEPWDSGE